MKTEKKPSEPSCVSPALAKEEPEPKRTKISQDDLVSANSNEPPSEDVANDCLKDAALEAVAAAAAAVTTSESNASGDNHTGSTTEQHLLNSVKQETESASSVEPSDCGPNLGLPNDGIQQLANTASNKQMATVTNSVDAQYVQQQSQIFVFSTLMANKGAEMVMQGQFPTIIAYHMAQPSTKKFLEKLPNKNIGSNLRQNSNQWLNNFNSLKQKGLNPNMGFSGEQPPDLPPLDPNESAFWNEQPNMRNLNGNNPLGNPESSMDDTNVNVPCLVPNSPSNPVNPQSLGNPALGPNQNLMGGTTSPNNVMHHSIASSLQPSLQGVKVPDENLTPQQRQHREEKLATLTIMGQMLFPKQKELMPGGMDPTQGNQQGAMGPAVSLPPVSVPNQCGLDWPKMQHHPILDQKKVGVGSPGIAVRNTGGGGIVGGPGSVTNMPGSLGGSVPMGGPVVGPRSQGPPPPYHQTTRSASVPIAIQSPNPSSPNNPTSNLSLPSPRASSTLNSPADCNRQFQLGSGGANSQTLGANQRSSTGSHLPGQSPTHQDSPSGVPPRLNHSNPGTPVSQSHLAMALSPSTPQKDPSSFDYSVVNQPPNLDGMLRSLQSALSQQKQPVTSSGTPAKELMPVPSPQQISSFVSPFDAQELTIQKQPNTSVKDGNNLPVNTQGNNSDMSGRLMSGSNIENNCGNSGGANANNQFGSQTEVSSPSIDNSNRGFGGPMHSPHTPHTPHTPGSAAPHTPVDMNKSGNKNSAQSSPANNNLNDMGMGPPRAVPASPNTKVDTSPTSKDMQQHQQQQQQSNMPTINLPNAVSTTSQSNMSSVIPSTPMNISTISQSNIPTVVPSSMNMAMPNSSTSQPNLGQTVHSSHMSVPGTMSSMVGSGNNPQFGCSRPSVNVSQSNDNVPLNPNNIGNRLGPLGPMSTMSFDPISSLAQMSQQLTNNASNNSMNNGSPPMNPNNNQGMMGFNQPGPPNMHMMQQQMQQQQMQQQNEMNGCHMGPGGGSASNELGEVSTLGLGLGGPATSYSPTPHTGSPGLSNKMGPMGQMVMGPHSMMGGPPGPNVNVSQGSGYPSGPGPGMMGGPNQQQQHPHGPYNGANVQVKPSAPNTIQYLPARPNVGHQPRGSPNLDFLRFANPSGLDNKMNSPSVNLQYFPNGCLPQGGQPGMGGLPGSGPGGPGVMGGPMPGMHPSMRPPVRQQPSLMRMQHMVGGGPVFPGNHMDSDKVFSPDMMGPGTQPGSPASGMYGGPKPQPNAMGQLGPPPDASQPLPPSMGGGSGSGPNFKNSPFIGGGPSMSDPNYAQQFHHFQQQLYATGTRGAGGGPQQGPGAAPGHPGAMHAQPQFFMNK